MRELNPDDYTAVWIAPLEIEARAAYAALDEKHEGRFPGTIGYGLTIKAGAMCGHNIIIVSPPMDTEYGNATAAAIASQLKTSFHYIHFGLLVGVAAGIPNPSPDNPRDIRLGDVIVALALNKASVVAYDLGKEIGQDEIELLRGGYVLDRTSEIVRAAITDIKYNSPQHSADLILPYYEQIQASHEQHRGQFNDPGQDQDQYFEVDGEGVEYEVPRELRLTPKRTKVWYGAIGSGDKLIKDRTKRNRLRDRYDLIGIEMEAAGAINRLQVGVIRGVCDYADPHKNKTWQPYAAAMAASYAKAVVDRIAPCPRTRPVLATMQTSVMTHSTKRSLPQESESDLSIRLKRQRTPQSDAQAQSSCPNTVQQEPNALDAEERKGLLQSLTFTTMRERLDTVGLALGETCKWLLETPEYRDWLDPGELHRHNGFLWIKGKPGAGKSTLMKVALFDARRKAKNARGEGRTAVVDFFFNAQGDALAKSTTGMYRSLLQQLLYTLPQLQSVLDDLWLSVRRNMEPNWSIPNLQQCFREAVGNLGKSRLMVFVDALDECDEKEVREMVKFFSDVSREAISKRVVFRVCFSSRIYPQIKAKKQIDLELTSQPGHSQDMRVYINDTVGHLIGEDDETSAQIYDTFARKANGVFMWVRLVVRLMEQNFRSSSTSKRQEIQEWLEGTPGSLHELLGGMITRYGDPDGKLLLCLQWILFAQKPMSPNELRAAIHFGVTREPLRPEKRSGGYCYNETEDFIIESSQGLAEITKSSSPTVQFIHESVRDFLLKDEEGKECLRRLWPHIGEDFEGESHDKLKQYCHRYVDASAGYMSRWTSAMDDSPKTCWVTGKNQARENERTWGEHKFPLFKYACLGLIYHANAAAGRGISQERFIREFPLANWIVLQRYTCLHEIRRHEKDARLLYILAECNGGNLIRYQEDKSQCFVQGSEEYCMPLLAAVASRSHGARLALMKAYADSRPDSPQLQNMCEQFLTSDNKTSARLKSGRMYRSNSVLCNVVAAGDIPAVEFAIAAGFRVADDGWKLLQQAAVDKNIPMFNFLAGQAGITASNDSLRRQPLIFALENCCRLADLRRLLDKRGDLLQRSSDNIKYAYVNALARNTRGGNAHTVQALLEYNDNKITRIFYKDDRGTLLMRAAQEGHAEVAIALLDGGFDPNEKSTMTEVRPLHFAAMEGHVEVARVLLENDTDIDARTDEGATPLWLAANHAQSELALLLVEKGADVNTANQYGTTPLILAAAKGTWDLVRALLDADAELYAVDTFGDCALEVARVREDIDIMQLLLDAADRKQPGGTYRHDDACHGGYHYSPASSTNAPPSGALLADGSDPYAQYGGYQNYVALSHQFLMYQQQQQQQYGDGTSPAGPQPK